MCSYVCLVLVYISVNLFLQLSERNVLESDKNETCLSVGNLGILSVIVPVACSASTACTSLCRGLKYFLKIPYLIIDYPNLVKILIF